MNDRILIRIIIWRRCVPILLQDNSIRHPEMLSEMDYVLTNIQYRLVEALGK